MPGRFLILCTLIAAVFPARSRGQSAPPPIDVVRAFCQADGRGDRVQPRRWAAIAPLVTWELEPAWDRVLLISGYQVHPPRFVTDHVEIDVAYTVTGQVSSTGADDAPGQDTVTFALVGDDRTGWRIDAPPPPPHLFASEVDAIALRAAMDPESPTYLSASKFVWRMLTEAGWPVPYRPVSALRDPGVFVAVSEPKPGDLAVFLANNAPYHVGIVTADDQIASATVNAGLMQTSPDAFAGVVLYLRLQGPLTRQAQPAEAAVAASMPEGTPPTVITPKPRPPATPSARVTKKPQRGKPIVKKPKSQISRRMAKKRKTVVPHHSRRPTATPSRRAR